MASPVQYSSMMAAIEDYTICFKGAEKLRANRANLGQRKKELEVEIAYLQAKVKQIEETTPIVKELPHLDSEVSNLYEDIAVQEQIFTNILEAVNNLSQA